MNWENGYGSSLILSDAWGTPGPDQNGEWKRLVTDTEFTKINDRKFQEMTVYCSLEEFVLEHKFDWEFLFETMSSCLANKQSAIGSPVASSILYRPPTELMRRPNSEVSTRGF